MRLQEHGWLRRKDNWPRWADAASPHNTERRDHSEDSHAPYLTSLRRGAVLLCGPSSLPRARSCPLGWCRPELKVLVCCLWSSGFVPHVLPFVGITYIYERWVAYRIRKLRVTFGDEFRDGKEGEMLPAPTAMARARRGDELVVGRASWTTVTITQPGITALEQRFEHLKVLAIRHGALVGADSGSRDEAGSPSPSIPPSDVGERCVGIMGNMYRRARRCLYVGGQDGQISGGTRRRDT